MAEEELASFITEYLAELSKKHSVRTPGWTYSAITGPRYIAARYMPPTELILVNRTLIHYYRVNAALTKDIVKFVLAHEFYHHTVMGGLNGMPLARLLARIEKAEHQRKADQFAEAETGIPAHMIPTHLFALRILAE